MGDRTQGAVPVSKPTTINLQALAQRIVQSHDLMITGTSGLPPQVAWLRDTVLLEAWSVLIDDRPSVAADAGVPAQEYLDRIMLSLTEVAADDAAASIEVPS